METVFLQILNMSVNGSYVIVVILLLRLLLCRAPKGLSYALWGAALFRLLCPFTFRSALSLMPLNPQPFPRQMLTAPVPRPDTGLAVVDESLAGVLPTPAAGDSVNPLQVLVAVLALIWAVAAAGMLLYGVVSAWRLHLSLRGARYEEKGVYREERLGTPFVFGLLHPRIYLPNGLGPREEAYILEHERVHIRRGDPLLRAISYLALCLHWFNPLVWLAYRLSAYDMEASCDERVLRRMGSGIKQEYSRSLLQLASRSRLGSPLAFGESGPAARIHNILRYRRPAAWAVGVAGLLLGALGVGLMLSPPEDRESLQWAKGLRAEEVESIELFVTPGIENPYHRFSLSEIPEVVDRINGSRGKYLPDPEALAGGGQTLLVTLKDGDKHQVSNIGNTYLAIDGDHYDAGYGWLSSWPYSGDTPLPLEYPGGEEYLLGNLFNSVSYDGKVLSFTLPNELPESFYLQISGRVVTADGMGMSWHALEEESAQNRWVPGRSYSVEVPEQIESIWIYASTGEENGVSSTLEIDSQGERTVGPMERAGD